ncbi:MAG: hypothetical protein WCJ55_14230 [Chloroflexales bacterium]
MRRSFWIAFWAALAAAMWRGVLRPARLHGAQVCGLRGEVPCYAKLTWSYGAGTWPQSVIFDLDLSDGAAGSVTTNGEARAAEVPFHRAAVGPYQITATATYRILGVVITRVYRFVGTLA